MTNEQYILMTDMIKIYYKGYRQSKINDNKDFKTALEDKDNVLISFYEGRCLESFHTNMSYVVDFTLLSNLRKD